jgi:nitroreductase
MRSQGHTKPILTLLFLLFLNLCRSIVQHGSMISAAATIRHSASIVLDMTARARQTGRNYVFFDAPVGLIFTTHSSSTKHNWLDCGLFLQSFMLAAHVRGLATCPQVSFVRFQSVIAETLGLEAEEVVTCGVSCGYEDKNAAVNDLGMPRESLDRISCWLGFDE